MISKLNLPDRILNIRCIRVNKADGRPSVSPGKGAAIEGFPEASGRARRVVVGCEGGNPIAFVPCKHGWFPTRVFS